MSILEAQARTMEVPTLDAFEGPAALDVPPACSPSSTAPDDDIPPGTAGRAVALGL
ncbi:MAG: hypothetical protein M5U22_19310 [Thermoleophilia bacterium]|nr:hypothetical protein [Thermoleophilia bacterium]